MGGRGGGFFKNFKNRFPQDWYRLRKKTDFFLMKQFLHIVLKSKTEKVFSANLRKSASFPLKASENHILIV